MTSQQTPAGRLHQLLADIRELPVGTTIEQAWAHALGVSPNDRGAILRGVAEAIALPAAIQEAFAALPNEDAELHLSNMPATVEALNFSISNLQTGIQGLTPQITEPILLSLRHCDSRLRRLLPERMVDPEKVTEWIAQVSEVHTEIYDAADIDPSTRLALLRLLTDVLDQLKTFKADGVVAVEGAMDRVAGAVLRRPDLFAQVPQPTVDKFTRVMTSIAVLLQAGQVFLAIPGESQDPQPPRPTRIIIQNEIQNDVNVSVVEHDQDVVDAEIVEDEATGGLSEPPAATDEPAPPR